MTIISWTIFVLTLLALLWGAPVMTADLTNHQWQKRLLLIFAPSPSDQRFTAFEKNLVSESADLRERDLLVFRIFEAGPSFRYGEALPPEDAEALRRRFRPRAGGFSLILIGKDGGVKLTGDERIALQTVFELIDQMPMRRQEMKAGGQSP